MREEWSGAWGWVMVCVVDVFWSKEVPRLEGSEKKTRRVGVEVLGGRVGLEW